MPAHNKALMDLMLLEVLSSTPSMTVLIRSEHLPGHLGTAMAMLLLRLLLKYSVC